MTAAFNQQAFDDALNELSEAFEAHTGILTLVTGKVEGKDHWAYALISPQNWPAFLHVQSQGSYDLSEYAKEIMAHGKGKTPPDGVLDKIRDTHPELDFKFEVDLQTALSAA